MGGISLLALDLVGCDKESLDQSTLIKSRVFLLLIRILNCSNCVQLHSIRVEEMAFSKRK